MYHPAAAGQRVADLRRVDEVTGTGPDPQKPRRMLSFYKDFLLEDGKTFSSGNNRDLFLVAFGKHPAWKDHVESIGVSSHSLELASRLLYVDGLGGKGGPI